MALLLLSRGESSMAATQISFIQFLDQAVGNIKRKFDDMIANISCCKAITDSYTRHGNVLGNGSLDDIMNSIGRHCQLRSEDWFSNKNEDNNGGNSPAVFSVLDDMLRERLERLKSMRESMSLTNIDVVAHIKENIVLDGITTVGVREHSSTIRNLCLGGKLGVALLLRRKMMQNGFVPDVFTHNHIVNGLCRMGELDMAGRLISEMLEQGPLPNSATYNTLVKGYCLMINPQRACNLLSHMSRTGFRMNTVTVNILVDAFCKEGIFEEAYKFLDENVTAKPDSETFTIFMDGYFKSKDFGKALGVWEAMLENNLQLDVVAYTVLIHGLCLAREMELAYSYSCQMLKRGILPDIFTYNTIISGLCRVGKFDEVKYIQKVMLSMGVAPDQISCKTIIRSLCLRDVYQAKNYLIYIQKAVVLEPLVWNLVLDGLARLGDLDTADEILKQMLSKGVEPNVYTYNALILACMRKGDINTAITRKEDMLSKGINPDVVTYNLLIGAACNGQDIRRAYQLLYEMRLRSLEPDMITYTKLIRAHFISGDLNAAREIFSYLRKTGLAVDHVSSLILTKSYRNMRQIGRYIKWRERNHGILALPKEAVDTSS
ncbi:unnamed protein product [Linum tenue]|uniref:Pentatricopeptide repeat-containing protein n=1 Tax=Linum tenue TaxID=586396 RepID=A0AAV0GV06_9ROSI|nr:unnamed protein product [Linum tenue]